MKANEFLYYIPGKKKVDAADLRAVGIDDLVPNPAFSQVDRGPCGQGHGVLFTQTGGRIVPPSDEQTWIDCEGYMIGVDPSCAPSEKDLRRDQTLSGHAVEMGDGAKWIVPMARSFMTGSPIPTRLVLGPDGKEWKREPLQKFVQFSKDAEDLTRLFFHPADEDIEGRELKDAEEPRNDLPYYIGIIARALRLNYRIDYYGVGLLGLISFGDPVREGELSSGNLIECLKAIVDFPGFEQLRDEMLERDVKKKEANDGDS